jgi:SAM-dependent methyltransferase
MQSLYSNGLEQIYDAMYQRFINYKNEFLFYSTILKRYKVKSVLEIGSGTGNLATQLLQSPIHYTGLDYSHAMIALAKQKNPKGNFMQADMCSFSLPIKTDSVLITGRTSSYLLDNTQIANTLNCIYDNMNEEGILCFDFIDANRWIKEIKGGKEFIHEATFQDKTYSRKSFMKETSLNNFMFQWDSQYFELDNNEQIEIAEDKSVLRCFTRQEWEIFLDLANFELLDCIDRPCYAFDTYVIVAKKNPKR